jgi:hypothetical protein
MINTLSCRAFCAGVLLAGYAVATCQAGQIFISSTGIAPLSERAVELLPSGVLRSPDAALSDLLSSGSPLTGRLEAARSGLLAMEIDSQGTASISGSSASALEANVAVARLEACRPLFNEWLKVARNDRLDAGSSADGWITSLVVPEKAPRSLTVARKEKWRKSVQQRLEGVVALAANWAPSRLPSINMVDELDRLRL